MSDPEEIKFACIGCGAYNPTAAEVCSGCGHRFAGPDLIPPVRIILPPRASDNPYEAPLTPIVPPRNFQIGTILIWIAVSAVCMGAFRENFALGVIAVVTLLPATIRTSFVAGARRALGRPMAWEERFATFLMTMLATWAILFASGIAFGITCFGTGLASQNIGVGVTFGAIGAMSCAVWLSRVFLRNNRDIARRERLRS